MIIIILITYALIVTGLLIAVIAAANADRQELILMDSETRSITEQLLTELSQVRHKCASLQTETENLKSVIARQDKDLTTSHKLRNHTQGGKHA